MMDKREQNRGFTLLEMLLSVALLGIIAGLSLPVYQSLQNKNALDVAVNTIAHSAYRAQALAESMSGDSSWGVFVTSSQIILFRGTSYASRNAAYDEISPISPTLSFSGTQEFVFTKFTGDIVTPGTITLTTLNNDSRSLTVSATGIIE